MFYIVLVETWFLKVFDFQCYKKYTLQISKTLLNVKPFSSCTRYLLWIALFFHIQECGKITVERVSSFLSCKALEDILLRHTVSMKNIIAGSWDIVLVNPKTQCRTVLNDASNLMLVSCYPKRKWCLTWLQLKQTFTMLLQNCRPSIILYMSFPGRIPL
jgi:hypothetical protein